MRRRKRSLVQLRSLVRIHYEWFTADAPPRVTVCDRAGSREHDFLTKHSGTRRKGGLSTGTQDNISARARCASLVCLPQQPSHIEGLYAAATFCTPGSRTHVGLTLMVLETGVSAHQDTASAERDYLDLRSDDRGMSHSAHDALELRFEAGLARTVLNTPAALRFPAAPSPSGPRRPRAAFSVTTTG